jgi:hypothetical protein
MLGGSEFNGVRANLPGFHSIQHGVVGLGFL